MLKGIKKREQRDKRIKEETLGVIKRELKNEGYGAHRQTMEKEESVTEALRHGR